MKKIFLLSLILFAFSVKGQYIMEQPHFFMGSEEAMALVQSEDTLKVFNGFIPMNNSFFNANKGHKNYRIIKTHQPKKEFFALYLEELNQTQKNNFSIWMLKKDDQTIYLLLKKENLDSSELENYPIDSLDYEHAFGIPYYSLAHFKELNKLKHIQTPEEYFAFEQWLETHLIQYQDLATDFQSNFRGNDIYGATIMGIILTQAATDYGVSPVYLGLIGHFSTDEKLTDAEKDEKLMWVYEELAPKNIQD